MFKVVSNTLQDFTFMGTTVFEIAGESSPHPPVKGVGTKRLEQPTVQGWILHYKDFWENFHISGFLCHKFIVLLSDFTLSIWFVTSEIKRVGKVFVNSV